MPCVGEGVQADLIEDGVYGGLDLWRIGLWRTEFVEA